MPGSSLRTRLRLFARDLVVDRLAGRLGCRLVRLPGRSGHRRVIVLAETVDSLLADRSLSAHQPQHPDPDSHPRPQLDPQSEPRSHRAPGLPRRQQLVSDPLLESTTRLPLESRSCLPAESASGLRPESASGLRSESESASGPWAGSASRLPQELASGTRRAASGARSRLGFAAEGGRVSGAARRVTVVVLWWVAPWRDWDGRPRRSAGATRAWVRSGRRGRGTIRVDVRADQPISVATAIDAARNVIRPWTALPVADGGESCAVVDAAGVAGRLREPVDDRVSGPDGAGPAIRPGTSLPVVDGGDSSVVVDGGPVFGRQGGVGPGDEGGGVVGSRVELAVLDEGLGDEGGGVVERRVEVGVLEEVRGGAGGPVLVDFERVNPRGRRAEAYRADAPRFVLLVDSSGSRLIPESGRRRAPWTWPGRPAWRELTGDLDWRTVTALRSVGVIECGQLSGVDAAAQASLVARLAMTGVVLHTTDIAPAVADRLAPELAAILTEPLSSVHAGPFDQEVRSVRQRRAALRDHSVQFGRNGHPAISVILTTRRTEYLPSILRAIAEQTYPYLEIVLCLHGIGLPAECADYLAHCGRPVEIVSAPAEMIFGIALGLATRRASGDLVTKFDDDDDYGPEHVWDLVLARAYSGATLVGKGIEFVHLVGPDITLRRRSGQPEAETDVVAGGTMLIGRSDLAELGGWQPVSHSVDQALLDRVNRAGAPVYRTHPFGYLYYRRESGHTWAADDAFFLRTAYQKWPGRPALPELTRA